MLEDISKCLKVMHYLNTKEQRDMELQANLVLRQPLRIRFKVREALSFVRMKITFCVFNLVKCTTKGNPEFSVTDVYCPPGCEVNIVCGTMSYDTNSSVCASAIHTGNLTGEK